jgi:hypothetical protein
MTETIGHLLRHLVARTRVEICDHIDYGRSYVHQDSPEGAAAGKAWHDHKVKVKNAGSRAR